MLNGDWMPNAPAPPPKREPRQAASVCKQKNREFFDKKKLLNVQLPMDTRTGYQLKVTTTNFSRKEYIKSAAGSLPAVWDRLPQELIEKGLEKGFRSIRKDCQRYLTGKKLKDE